MDQQTPERPMLIGIEGTSSDQRILDHAQLLFTASLVLEGSDSPSTVAPISLIAREDVLTSESYPATESTFLPNLRNALIELLHSTIVDAKSKLRVLANSLAIRQQIEASLGCLPDTYLQPGISPYSWFSSHTSNGPWKGWLFGDDFSDSIRRPGQMYKPGRVLPLRTVFRAGGITIPSDTDRSLEMTIEMYDNGMLYRNDATIAVLPYGHERMLGRDLSGNAGKPIDSTMISANSRPRHAPGRNRNLFHLTDDVSAKPGTLSRTSVVIAALALAKFNERYYGISPKDNVHSVFMPLDRIVANSYRYYPGLQYSQFLTYALEDDGEIFDTRDDVRILGHNKNSLTFEITHTLSQYLGYNLEP